MRLRNVKWGFTIFFWVTWIFIVAGILIVMFPWYSGSLGLHVSMDKLFDFVDVFIKVMGFSVLLFVFIGSYIYYRLINKGIDTLDKHLDKEGDAYNKLFNKGAKKLKDFLDDEAE